jgi:phosphoribosylformimino-5-aminoimidazole carboxamide ribotide isomerase
MVIIPAIDILNGQCVRLTQGNYENAVYYDADPVERARSFEALGIKRIHIVDLDAARGEGKTNREVIRHIRETVPCTLEVGGGIRSEEDVKELIDRGVDRMIVGTILVRDPDLVARWVSQYGNRFLAGIDARDGEVRISGWLERTGISDREVARLAKNSGVCGIIYTNISRDGTLRGPDFQRTVPIAEISGLPVVLSGGVSSEQDIRKAAELQNRGIAGVIVGKALYERKINLESLIRIYPQPSQIEW